MLQHNTDIIFAEITKSVRIWYWFNSELCDQYGTVIMVFIFWYLFLYFCLCSLRSSAAESNACKRYWWRNRGTHQKVAVWGGWQRWREKREGLASSWERASWKRHLSKCSKSTCLKCPSVHVTHLGGCQKLKIHYYNSPDFSTPVTQL